MTQNILFLLMILYNDVKIIWFSAKLGDVLKCVSVVSGQDNAVLADEVCSSEGVFSEEEKFGHVLTLASVIQSFSDSQLLHIGETSTVCSKQLWRKN